MNKPEENLPESQVEAETRKLETDFKNSRRVDQNQEREVALLEKELRIKGLSDEEAAKQARNTILKSKAVADEAFNRFATTIKLYEVLDDIMRTVYREYADEWNKKRPNEPIEIKLEVTSAKPNKGGAFAAGLRTIAVYKGKAYVLLYKQVNLPHIKVARRDNEWKWSLYNEMWKSLIFNGLTLLMINLTHQENGNTSPNSASGKPE